MKNSIIFVAKTRNYDIFVAKIYDNALIDSFPRFIDSSASYVTLGSDEMSIFTFYHEIDYNVFSRKVFHQLIFNAPSEA